MANNVFANGREVSCKAGDGKTIAAFPDVCMTPPENPATPPGVPVPYPNNGMASDTTSGSKAVKVSDKEVMLKNKSYFKKSTGDEAGCAAKKGVITSTNRGKIYFATWSMDVKFEGENVVRHLDMTTHNHASPVANEAVPWAHIDTGTFATDEDCEDDKGREKEACEDKGYPPEDACKGANLDDEKQPNSNAKAIEMGYKSKVDYGDKKAAAAQGDSDAAACIRARRCRLKPFRPDQCCKSQTGDHLLPKSSFYKKSVKDGNKMAGWDKYDANKAPVMCLEGGSNSGNHGIRHSHHKCLGIRKDTKKNAIVTFESETKAAAESGKAAAPHCNQDCLEAQIRDGHKGMGDGDVKYSPTGGNVESKAALDKKREGLGGSP